VAADYEIHQTLTWQLVAKQKRTRKTIKGFAATRGPRDITRQAASDLARGLEDTDCRAPRTSEGRCPRPAARKKA
jgi:hypothetical protein